MINIINVKTLRKSLYIVVVMVSQLMFAQQDSQYTQYMYNTQTINPGYAGSRGMFSLTGLYRSQWVGFNGAPETLNFSFNTPVGERVGIGLSFYTDEIGISKEDNIAADFSYTINLNDRGTKLAFGLKAGLNILDVDFSKLNPNNPNDPAFSNANNIEGQISPVIGTGLYLTHRERWYLGLSAPSLLKTKHYDQATISTADERIHLYLIGGYVFDLSPSWKFKPAFLMKSVAGSPIAVDLSANFWYNEKLTLGGAYRFDSGISGLLGFQVTKGIMLGYAYDYDLTDIAEYAHGSHEFFLRFEIGGRKSFGVINPRFF